MNSMYRRGFGPVFPLVPSPQVDLSTGELLPDTPLKVSTSDVETHPLPTHADSTKDGKYTFNAVMVEGVVSGKKVSHRVHSRESVTVNGGINKEHAMCLAARVMVKRYPWLSNDHSMLYLNSITIARRFLNQRPYVVKNTSSGSVVVLSN